MNFKNTFYFIVLGAATLFLWPSCGSDDSSMEEAAQTCSDGIQNQDETGVDCGGVCELCGPPSSGNFFYAVIDGEETSVTGSNGVGSGNCNEYFINGGIWLTDPINNPDIRTGVSLVKFFAGAPDDNDLYEMFAEGTYDFGSCDGEMNGAEIEWADADGGQWFSQLGSQSGSTFTVTSRGSKNGYETTVEGTFSCKLYNLDGAEKTVVDGQFRTLIGLF